MTDSPAGDVHLMIDLETLGTSPGCVVLSIGACVFDADSVLAKFECHVDIDDQLSAGLTVERDTLIWWLEQSEDARLSLIEGQHRREDISEMICLFEAWLEHWRPKTVWSHGATFDIPILECLVKRYSGGTLSHWPPYNMQRDTRTLFEIAKKSPREFLVGKTAHKAVDDAVAQAQAVQASWRVIEKWKSALDRGDGKPFEAKVYVPDGPVASVS